MADPRPFVLSLSKHVPGTRSLTGSGRTEGLGFTHRPRSAEHGFTLIEVLVALAVFALAALALVRLEGATLRSAAVLDRTLLAQIVARNVAIEAVTDARPPALGPNGGTAIQAGRRWNWTRIVSGTGDARAVRIDVAVRDQAGQVLSRITMVRPPTPGGDK